MQQAPARANRQTPVLTWLYQCPYNTAPWGLTPGFDPSHPLLLLAGGVAVWTAMGYGFVEGCTNRCVSAGIRLQGGQWGTQGVLKELLQVDNPFNTAKVGTSHSG